MIPTRSGRSAWGRETDCISIPMASPRRWTLAASSLATPDSWRRSAKGGPNRYRKVLRPSSGRSRGGRDPRDLKTISPSWRPKSRSDRARESRPPKPSMVHVPLQEVNEPLPGFPESQPTGTTGSMDTFASFVDVITCDDGGHIVGPASAEGQVHQASAGVVRVGMMLKDLGDRVVVDGLGQAVGAEE